ncbi:MAG: hypothetical protein ACYS1A_10190 [Planctomycetota bacterium]|jgi:hypothetical protein
MFGKKYGTDMLAKLTTANWIAILSVIVTAIGVLVVIILHFCPKKQNGEQIAREIRSENIASEINNLLLGGVWYRAKLLISHLSQSFPKQSVIDQLIKMEKEGTITWGGGPMKPDAQVRLVK